MCKVKEMNSENKDMSVCLGLSSYTINENMIPA